MLFKKDELKLLWPFYAYYLIYGLSTMIIPFMILYFRNVGFSFFQIAILTSAFGISMFLSEIPTGAFADSFSRKYSVIVGFFITAVAVMLIPLVSNFYLLLLLWILAGLGMAFASGAEEAWVIDNLHKFKRKDLQHHFFVKSGSFVAFGAIFAPFIGALLVKAYSIKILWFVFGFGFLLNALLLMFFGEEHYKPKKITIIESAKQTWLYSKKGLQFTITHKIVFLLVLAGLCTQLMTIGDNGWQPFLVDLGMAEHQLGYMYSAAAALAVIMPFLSGLFVNIKPKNAISILVFVRMILFFLLLFIFPPFFLLAAFVFAMGLGLWSATDPLLQTYFHKFIPTKIRATVVSSKSMFTMLVVSLSSLVAGVFLDLFGPQKVLAFGSLFGVVAIWLYQKIKD